MQHRSTHRSTHRKWIFPFAAILLTLMVATPVLADYLGPNRTVTETISVCKVVLNECKYVEAKDSYNYKQVNTWSCSNESKPWQAYPSDPPRSCSAAAVGEKYWSREDNQETQTVTHPPATITGMLQNCTLQNGWCITAAQLSLTGYEPVAGHSIIGIEGTRNGQNFACIAGSCNIPLDQGTNNFTFWALSSFLDSSTMGSLTAKVDSQIPTITGALTGTTGSNGWYISSVSFNGSAADATSGLANFTCTLDAVALGSCNSISVNSDGLHTLVLTARDNAGLTRTLTQNVSIDTKNPVLAASISGTRGSNDWYTAATLNASASDPSPGSGLSIFQYNLNGSGWTGFPTSGTLQVADGSHSVNFRAIDNAGRIVASSTSFSLDTVPPGVAISPAGTEGLNNWYTSSLNLTASASDSTSGMDVFEYSLDNGAWQMYGAPLTLGDGTHSISLWAQDKAGHVTQVDRTYHVDTRPPQIAGSLNGTPGTNGWYISDVTLSAAPSDPLPGSGMDAFSYTLNGNAQTPYTDPLVLSDGHHTVQFSAEDKAGLSYSIEQSLKVDTTHPSLKIATILPNWVMGQVALSGTASDGGSGLSKVELSTDGGQTWRLVTGTDSWAYTWNTLESLNGAQQLTVRATDLAGLTTQQTIGASVDNHGPKISLPDSWFQWDAITLDVWDNHSGVSDVYVEVIDPEGHWTKRVIKLDPEGFPLEFKRDRRFGDDTVAPLGIYSVKVIALDKLGNMGRSSASVKILLDILPAGPTATLQPYSRSESTPTPLHTLTPFQSPMVTPTAIVSVFGVIEPTAQTTPTPGALPTPRAIPSQTGVIDWLQSFFIPNFNGEEQVTEIGPLEEAKDSPPSSTAESIPVLWGTAAAAAIGAATAYAREEQRKREEEKAKQIAREAREEERRKKLKERKIAKMEAQRAQERAWEEAREKERIRQQALEGFQGLAARTRLKNELTDWEMQEEAKWEASQAAVRNRHEEKKKKEEEKKKTEERKKLQERKEILENSQIQEETTTAVAPPKKTWWDKALDFVDEHQAEIALGVGILVGVTAVVVSGGLAIPAVPAIIAATVTAGIFVGGGTVALNAHYDRPWHENLLRNVALAGGAALVTSGAGLLVPKVFTGISSYCAVHQSTCARVEPVLNAWDKGEEIWLQGKLAYQTWRGDQFGAAETAMELHSEYVDGGMPGNAVARELGDQLTHLSKNAAPLIQKYGNDVVPLLLKHGDEGLQFIQKYGLDAIDLLKKHGNDATGFVHLDKDVLEYVIQQGDDAVEALSRWSADELREHGLELALRAKKDANVLADIKKLTSSGPVDPKNLTKEQKELIEAIAANSTQYADNGQVVLGKWVDISNGFVQTAQETGSVHYNPHPDMWTMLGKLGDEKQEEVAWLVNKQVVQNGIANGLPFEYTLNGVPTGTIDNEIEAVEAIFSGKAEAEVKEILESRNLPIRMKELQELQKAGYDFVFDSINNSYIFVKP